MCFRFNHGARKEMMQSHDWWFSAQSRKTKCNAVFLRVTNLRMKRRLRMEGTIKLPLFFIGAFYVIIFCFCFCLHCFWVVVQNTVTAHMREAKHICIEQDPRADREAFARREIGGKDTRHETREANNQTKETDETDRQTDRHLFDICNSRRCCFSLCAAARKRGERVEMWVEVKVEVEVEAEVKVEMEAKGLR